MGHDIDLKINNATVASTYISFNWTSWQKYFHISDIHGHSGENGVIRKLTEALEKLKKDKYVPDPDIEIILDGWGNASNDHNLTEDELTFQQGCVFASHIARFLQLAENYPKAYWYTDQCYEPEKKLYQFDPQPRASSDDESDDDTSVANVILKSQQAGDYATIDTDSEEDVVRSQATSQPTSHPTSHPVTYYRHPIKGNMRIDNYASAMEIHLLSLNKKDPRAMMWFNLALQMPDCPVELKN